jgi:hypothetical protein
LAVSSGVDQFTLRRLLSSHCLFHCRLFRHPEAPCRLRGAISAPVDELDSP